MDEEKRYHCLLAGTILQDRYRIDGFLGEGGFGITYRGTEVKSNIPVAIKEFFPYGYVIRETAHLEPKPDEASREIFKKNKKRFLDEARKLAKCENIPSVVGVHEYFEDNGTAYIVMEFLDGITLAGYLKENSEMNSEWLCRMTIPLLRDIDAVHQLGFLHRDISPDNIMLMPEGHLKLMDFGASREFDWDNQRSMTVMLKSGFAPFEQYTRHGNQGPWTDVYALSATIYACITNKTPETAPDRMIEDRLKRPSEVGIEINPELEQVILKGLSIRYEDRFQSAEEMARALEGSFRSSGISAGRQQSQIYTVLEEEIEKEQSEENQRLQRSVEEEKPQVRDRKAERQKGKGSGSRYMWVGGIIIVCLILLAGMLWAAQKRDNSIEAVMTAPPTIEAAKNQTAMPSPTPEVSPTPTASPTPAVSPTPAASPTPTASPTPVASPRATSSPTPTVLPISTPTAIPAYITDDFEKASSMYYKYRILEDGTIAITEYTGVASKILIPSELEGKKVSAINSDAFYDQKNLIEVVIPNGVVKIGDRAFGYCENLQKVWIGESVSELGENPFVECGNLAEVVIDTQNQNIRIENGFIVTIPDRMLIAGIDLDGEVSIPDDVKGIGGAAFQGNNRISYVVIPEGVISIGRYAFYNCTGLDGIEIPESVEVFGNMAFGNDIRINTQPPILRVTGKNKAQLTWIELGGWTYTLQNR